MPSEAGGKVELRSPVVVVVFARQARLVGFDLEFECVDGEPRTIAAAEAVLGIGADVVERATCFQRVLSKFDREERPADSRGPVIREMVVVTQSDERQRKVRGVRGRG